MKRRLIVRDENNDLAIHSLALTCNISLLPMGDTILVDCLPPHENDRDDGIQASVTFVPTVFLKDLVACCKPLLAGGITNFEGTLVREHQ